MWGVLPDPVTGQLQGQAVASLTLLLSRRVVDGALGERGQERGS